MERTPGVIGLGYVCNFQGSGSRENGFRMGLRYKELLTYIRAMLLFLIGIRGLLCRREGLVDNILGVLE